MLRLCRDSWGRKWCHVVAMDAIYFRNASAQYNMQHTKRELLKAYASFRPLGQGADYEFGIATGSWGCGAFHGDKELKGIDWSWMSTSICLTSTFSYYSIDGCIRSRSTVDLCSVSWWQLGEFFFCDTRLFDETRCNSGRSLSLPARILWQI